jgi:hypothetical protein
LVKIKNNPHLDKFSLTFERLAKETKGVYNGAGVNIPFDEVITHIDEFVTTTASRNIQFTNGEYLVTRFFTNAEPDKQAVYWIMEDIMSDVQSFSGKSLEIEMVLDNGKRIDVVRANPKLWIEYKWSSTSETVSRSKFLDEFVSRDLTKIDNLNNLQWRIKGEKLTKNKVVEYLSSPEGRIELKKISATQANRILGRTDLSDLNKDAIADAFISYFNNDTNFTSIFK